VVLAVLLASGGVIAQHADREQVLRNKLFDASTAGDAGPAFEEYFHHIGAAGVRQLLSDKNIGTALQAAWEVHKTAVKRREHVSNRTDDVYDPDGLSKFLAFLKDRTKAPIPDWWAAGILDIELFPGRHLASGERYLKDRPKFKKTESGRFVAEKVQLVLADGIFRYSVGDRTVVFPDDTFDKFASDCLSGLLRNDWAVIAAFSQHGGFGYKLAAFDRKRGKTAWSADVWAGGRTILGGEAFHRIELVEEDGSLFVFGAESHGMYLEAFDAVNGKCLYRFCNGYWFHFSEAWGVRTKLGQSE
jgi:hypothetical protein